MHDTTRDDHASTLASPSATEATATGGGEPSAAAPSRGALIGRYVVLSKLGAGAMGVVLAAYDPELDRKVALKLLKTRGGSKARAGASARLQREAQALAKLDHPNVVGVHDVGVHEGQLFMFTCALADRTPPDGWACGFINDCPPGSACVEASLVGGCEGDKCCTPFCDLGAVADPCPDSLPGTTCQVFEPPLLEDQCEVGICRAP